MFSVTFDFECTYIREVQYNCSAHRFVHLFIIATSSHNHKERKEPQFFFSDFFPHSDLIQRDTHIQSKCRKKACNFVKKRIQHRCFPVNIAKFLRTAFSTEHLLLFLNPEAYLETRQTSKWEFFTKINAYKPLTIFAKKTELQIFDWVLNAPL